MVFISKEKLHVSAYSGHLHFLTIFCQNSLYNMPKSRGDVEISSSIIMMRSQHHHAV